MNGNRILSIPEESPEKLFSGQLTTKRVPRSGDQLLEIIDLVLVSSKTSNFAFGGSPRYSEEYFKYGFGGF